MSEQSKNILISEYKQALEAAEVARDRARVEESVARQARDLDGGNIEIGLSERSLSVRRSHQFAWEALKRMEAAYLCAKQKYEAACRL